MGAITWKSGVSGNWSTAANWNGSLVPGSLDAATIAAPGSYVVGLTTAQSVASLTLNAPGAAVSDSGTLAVSGLLTLSAGQFQLAPGGVLKGGTIVQNGGALLAPGGSGTLDGVSARGTLALTGAGTVTVANGITLTGTSGTGPGALDLSRAPVTLNFNGNQKLDSASVSLGWYPGGSGTGLATSYGSQLTLGPKLSLTMAGQYARLWGSFLNQGTITDQFAGGTLEVYGQSFVNQGRIVLGGGGTLSVYAASLANSGTVTVGTGGVLNLTPAGWTNAGTINVAGGTLNLGGTIGLANLGGIGNSGGIIAVQGVLDAGGGTLAIGTGTALGRMALRSGTIRNGTVADSGGGLALTGGAVLDNVRYQGTLDLSQASASAVLRNGTVLTGSGGSGSGRALVTGPDSLLSLQGTQTLDRATILLGPGTLAASEIPGGGLATVSLGTNAVVQAAAPGAVISVSTVPGDLLVSNGTITSSSPGASLTIQGGAFINNGTIQVGGGALALADSGFVNAGLVTVTAGGTLDLGMGGPGSMSWRNPGTISETGATVRLWGLLAPGQLGTIRRAGGTLTIAGTYDGSIGTLTLGTGAALGALNLSGTIANALVHDNGGGLTFSSDANPPVLDHVTYQGTLAVTGPGLVLTVRDGLVLTDLTGTAAGVANITGTGSTLSFEAMQGLDNALVTLGATLAETHGTGPSVLTLGPDLVIQQTGGLAALQASGVAGDGMVNQGTIIAAISGGVFSIGGAAFTNQGTIAVSSGEVMQITAGTFTNSGTVTVTTGGVLALGGAGSAWSSTGTIRETGGSVKLYGAIGPGQLGAITRSGGEIAIYGTLDEAGHTLTLGTGTLIGGLRLAGTILNTIIHDAGGGLVFHGDGIGAPGGTLDGVTYQGALNLVRAWSDLTIRDGLSLTSEAGTGAGVVKLVGAGSRLSFQGSQVFDNAVINIGNGGVADTLNISDATGGGAVLTLGTGASLIQRGALAQITSDRGFDDGLVNAGTIQAAFAGGSFAIYGGSFTNQGVIAVGAGETFSIAADTFTNLTNAVLSGGSYQVGAGSTLDLGMDGNLTALAADVRLTGAGSVIRYLDTDLWQTVSLDSTLTRITGSGTLHLLGGRGFTGGASFSNGGTLELGGSHFSAGTITNTAGARIFGTGTLAGAVTSSGTIEATGSLAVAGAISGAGKLLVDAGATLELDGAVAAGQTASFTGSTGVLRLDAASSFSGSITGFALGGTIDLHGVTATGGNYAAGVLTVVNAGTTVASLKIPGSFTTANFHFSADGAGGTFITDPPAPAKGGLVLEAGSGNETLIGSAGNDRITLGTGNATVISEAGSDLFIFVAGQAGGADLIRGFGPADRVNLRGYKTAGVQHALATAVTHGGSTTLTLPDHTRITFAGVEQLDPSRFHVL